MKRVMVYIFILFFILSGFAFASDKITIYLSGKFFFANDVCQIEIADKNCNNATVIKTVKKGSRVPVQICTGSMGTGSIAYRNITLNHKGWTRKNHLNDGDEVYP